MVTRGRPRRAQVYWVEFEPVDGAEMGKTRPAVVIQNDSGNAFAQTTIVATITSRQASDGYPFLVGLPDGTLKKPSTVNCAHVRTVDLSRVVSGPIARLDEPTMHKVDRALMASLGIK